MNTDLLSLFAEYDQADKDVELLRIELEGALTKRSQCVRAIRDSAQSSGPFNHNGHACKIVQRGETFFFRTSKMVSVDASASKEDK